MTNSVIILKDQSNVLYDPHISNQKSTWYKNTLSGHPAPVTRSIPCGSCKKYFLIQKKRNGDVVNCPRCGATHTVTQKIAVVTSVELVI